MTFSEELIWRGFVNQTTLENLSELDKKKWTFYHGFDAASADSLQVGNLAAVMLDRLFMSHGHHAIMLAGGATSLIGDPGGKDSERPLPNKDEVISNIQKIEKQLQTICGDYDFKLVNNLDWTESLSVIEFLRDTGKYFSMTPLLQRDYIAKRLGEGGGGISYAEFSYTVLQGFDYIHLYKNFNCSLQLGGSDQWGNCLSGVELIRRKLGGEAHVITLPLIINKTTGKKFGKSEEGAVWLDAAKTTPTQFYQFWINSEDDAVEEYLKIFTQLDKQEIDEVMKRHSEVPGKRLGQKTLAQEVTRLVHGQPALLMAEQLTDILVGEKSLSTASPDLIKILRQEIKTVSVSDNLSAVEALVAVNLATSRADARRLLEAGAISINGRVEKSPGFKHDDFSKGFLLLRRGKAYKDSALVELTKSK